MKVSSLKLLYLQKLHTNSYKCIEIENMMSMMVVFFSVEAVHVATLMASHGYFFPIDDHYLIVKNDNTYYRFQVRPNNAVNDFKTLT